MPVSLRPSCAEAALLTLVLGGLVYSLLLFSLPSLPAHTSIGVLRHIRNHIQSIPDKTPNRTVALHLAKEVTPASLPEGLYPGPDIASDGIDDSVTAVVECATSAGNLTIDVRAGWAPIGAKRYLDLVERGLFEELPFFRVCPKYVTQFGVKHWPQGNPLVEGGLTEPLPDDPSLWGRRDMRFGFLFFAGSGGNSRTTQMVIALCPTEDQCRLTGLGKAFWEVPVGSIRRSGFSALERIGDSGKPYPRLEMIGQDPKAGGPFPWKIASDPEYLRKEFPFMEFWRGCSIAHRDIRLSRPLRLDAVGTDGTTAETKGSEMYYVLLKVLTPRTSAAAASCESSGECIKGEVLLEISREVAPIGAERFQELVVRRYFDQARFFRAIPNFMVQFGIAADPSLTKEWRFKTILDDEVKMSNKRGTISFATSGPNSRSTQLFINVEDNTYLDSQGFAPIGRVVHGMEVIDGINFEYGEGGKGDGSDGKGPSQGRLSNEGNTYLLRYFPRLSYIASAILQQKP